MTQSSGRPDLPTPEDLVALPPDGGPNWNRLVFEQSPYLLQHAANPVDWWPWSEAAFEEARRLDRPIFLSVGYATCHWCHVMERESFEDEEVAKLLNDSFVCVKVDREERPDVDHVYMTVTFALTGAGGWPMTVALTPDRQPFFAGTYFPKQGRIWARPGMLQLVPALAEAWRERRDRVIESASEIVNRLASVASASGPAPTEEALDRAHDQLLRRFDALRGGFGHAPKFPTPHVLSFLARHWARTGTDTARQMAETTLDAMRRGGIHDHVGFGFHRYSTDREWLVPHFEKMLYDQALMVVAALDAHQAFGQERHAQLARDVLAYVRRDLTSPEGAFFSAEDADSEGVEGKFYLWTPDQVAEVLRAEDAKLYCEVLNVRRDGNYREEATGQHTGESIPHLRAPLEEIARELGHDPAELGSRLESCRSRLVEARGRRIRPLLDDKVLTDWNGLMIAAFARAARVLGEPEHAEAARRAAEFVLSELRDADGRLLKRWRAGRAGLPAVLDDHAFLAWGLVELFEATQEPRWLREALSTLDVMLLRFRDDERGGLCLTADDGESLPVRARQAHDGALPAGNSVAAFALLRAARLTGRSDLEDRASDLLAAVGEDVRQAPAQHAFLLWSVDFALGPAREVVICGDPSAEDTRQMLAAVREPFLPNVVTLLRPAGEDRPPIAELAPFVTEMRAREGRATAHVCTARSCDAPVSSVAELRAKLAAGP